MELSDIRFEDKYRVLPDVYDVPSEKHEVDKEGTQEAECPVIRDLENLVDNFERTHDWSLVLRVGDMYARGCYPRYCPDDVSALIIYRAASKCPDPRISCEALSRFIDLRTNPISIEDRKGSPFPKEASDRLVGYIDDYLKKIPLSHYMRKRQGPVPVRNNVAASRRVPVDINDAVIPPVREPTRGNNVPVEEPVREIYTVDPQNVHDHGVSASVRENIKAVVSEFGPGGPGNSKDSYDRTNLIDEVMQNLRSTGMEESKMNDAFRVVASLVPDMISSVGCSQMDVLNAVFSKIKSVPDIKVRANLMESLGKNLSSGVERGHVVCSTGKIGRIITTLEGIDHEDLGSGGSKMQKSIPIDVIRNEISTLASKVREDVLGESTERRASEYETSTCSPLSETMNNRFREEVKATYVDGLHLSEKVIGPIVDTYASVF